jgi:hypothetical protein
MKHSLVSPPTPRRAEEDFAMKRTVLLLCVAATLAAGIPVLVATAGPDIVSAPVATSKLELRDLAVGSDGSVTGTVVNGGESVIKEVELLVTHVWSWSDERHPGKDNPGRSSFVRVSGELSANGSLPFSYTPNPPLPTRADGSFQTTAAVQSFTEVEN